ncbi:hypothetical protein BDR22DRAFT_816643 [Usnea florida]
MVLEMTYLDGPDLPLRVPRIFPWTHPLWRCSIYGDFKAVQRLFADRIASPHDIDPAGRNAMVHVSEHRSTELAVFLFDRGAGISHPDSLGLGGTARERFLKRSFGGMCSENDGIIRRILKGYDSFDKLGLPTLHKIVLRSDIRELQVVLDATTDTLNSPDSFGRTFNKWSRDSAVHLAAHCDRPDILKVLLVFGANYIVLECYCRNLAHYPVKAGSTGLLRIMTAALMTGLDTELKDHEGKTSGKHIESRNVMNDREVGVNEAWEEFIASLTPPQVKRKLSETATVGRADLDLGEYEQCERRWKIPGAYPTTAQSTPLDSGQSPTWF